jgi:hypothetical protein
VCLFPNPMCTSIIEISAVKLVPLFTSLVTKTERRQELSKSAESLGRSI